MRVFLFGSFWKLNRNRITNRSPSIETPLVVSHGYDLQLPNPFDTLCPHLLLPSVGFKAKEKEHHSGGGDGARRRTAPARDGGGGDSGLWRSTYRGRYRRCFRFSLRANVGSTSIHLSSSSAAASLSAGGVELDDPPQHYPQAGLWWANAAAAPLFSNAIEWEPGVSTPLLC